MAKTRKKKKENDEQEDEQEQDDVQEDAQKDEKSFLCTRHCGAKFKHKTQMYRHKKSCSGRSPKKMALYKKDGSNFVCLKCGKQYSSS